MSTPQTEYLKATEDLNFPFARVFSANPLVNDMFGDIYVVTPNNDGETIYLEDLQVVSSNIVRVRLANDFENILKYPPNVSGNAFFVRSNFNRDWTSTLFTVVVNEASSNVLDTSAVFLASKSGMLAVGNCSYNGMHLPLLNRNVDSVTAKTRSLYVDGAVQKLVGDIELIAGNNIVLSVALNTEDPLRPSNTIVIDCIPGAGAGKFKQDCEDDASAVIRTVNGVAPTNKGEFTFSPKSSGCHWIYNTPATHELKFHNNCTACLVCDDVATAYCNLRGVWKSGVAIRERLCDGLEVYRDYVNLVDRFKAQLGQPKATVVLERTDDEAYDVIFRLQVGSQSSVVNVDVDFTYTFPSGSGSELATFRSYSGRRKLPKFAPTQLAPSFDGTNIGYIAGVDGDEIEANRYAAWYWNMNFHRCDGTNTALVIWSGTVTYDDASVLSVNGSQLIDVTPISCSS